MKKLNLLIVGLLAFGILAGCGSGETQNDPKDSFANDRDARKAARDAAKQNGTAPAPGVTPK